MQGIVISYEEGKMGCRGRSKQHIMTYNYFVLGLLILKCFFVTEIIKTLVKEMCVT